MYSALLILVWSIPNNNARKNLFESMELLEQEGNYKRFFPCISVAQTENWSDGYWWNMAYHSNINRDNIIKSAFAANYYEVKDASLLGVENLLMILKNAGRAGGDSLDLQRHSYGRYWQGMTVVIFPLLYFFNIYQIRIVFYIIMVNLFIIFLFLIYFRLGREYCGVVLSGLWAVHFYAIPVSAQYVTCFLVMLIFSLICLKKYPPEDSKLPLYFFVVGSVVNYIDFLTTPVITFTVPMAILLVRYRRKSDVIFVVKNGFSWSMGYVLTWVMKWILTYVIVGSEGYMTDIRNHITQRASLSQGSLQHLKDYVIGAGHNVIGLCETPFIIPLIIAGIIFFCRIKKSGSVKAFFLSSADFFVVFCVQFAWMFVFAEHSRVHYHFTYRGLLGSMMAMFFSIICYGKEKLDEGK